MQQLNVIRRTMDFIKGRKTAYQLAFKTVAGEEVLADLARFCRAKESVYNVDVHKTHVLIGRREVFDRIAQHLNLSTQELYHLYGGPIHQPQEGDQ